jgi:hypothetical protein
MIDIRTETMLTVSKAARFYSERFGGKKSPSAVYRWMAEDQRPPHEIRLEYVQTPDGRRTSVEAIERFVAALTSAEGGRRVPSRLEEVAELRARERLRARGLMK